MHQPKGNLRREDIMSLLARIVPVLDNKATPYWLTGGVLRDVLLGDIGGPHGDIDLLIMEHDAPNIKIWMDAALGAVGTLNQAKLQYAWDGDSAYVIEFILLHENPEDVNYYETATTPDMSNKRTFPKAYIGNGELRSVTGLDFPLRIPAQPKELLKVLESTS
jgi:hypothetical protein